VLSALESGSATELAGRVVFVAVGGAGTTAASGAQKAQEWGLDQYLWGVEQDVWGLYGVSSPPYTIIVSPGGEVTDVFPGEVHGEDIRQVLEERGFI